MFIVYVIYSESAGKRYIGFTQDLATRLSQHNGGRVKATKGGRPWTVVYSETLFTRRAAMQRERSLKSGQGRAEIDRILRGRGSAP